MKKNYFLFVLAALAAGLLFLAGCGLGDSASAALNIPEGKVTLYKSPTCGCCAVYSSYLGKKGLKAEIVDVPDIQVIKEQYKIPSSMESCHTTVIGDYFVEGHVPLEAIAKLMAEKPDIRGIAMPGMPTGSPGMSGAKSGPFVVYAVGNNGNTYEFMRI